MRPLALTLCLAVAASLGGCFITSEPEYATRSAGGGEPAAVGDESPADAGARRDAGDDFDGVNGGGGPPPGEPDGGLDAAAELAGDSSDGGEAGDAADDGGTGDSGDATEGDTGDTGPDGVADATADVAP